MNLIFPIAVIISFGGLVICRSIYVKRNTGHPLIAPIGTKGNVVLSSGFSKLFNVPVEIIGALYYTIIVLSYSAFIANPEFHGPGAALVILELTVVALIYSLYLIVVQTFVLKNWCFLCLLSALICLFIFLIEFKIIGFDPISLAIQVLT